MNENLNYRGTVLNLRRKKKIPLKEKKKGNLI